MPYKQASQPQYFKFFYIYYTMNDFNMVNVEAQSQVGKSIDTIKVHNLKMDLQDYTKLLPTLKELQNTSSKIVRQFDDYLSKKERKSMSLPYNMIKKFQTLKNQFYQSSQLLNLQTHIYHTNVCNRDYEKLHEQLFFKKTMKSYDEKRLWMKNYILKNQSKMQVIEQEVKKNVEYETHKFTDFRNQLNIERLEHNYENKIDLIQRNQTLVNSNNALRYKIKQRLKQIAKIRSKEIQNDKRNNAAEGDVRKRQQKKEVDLNKLVRQPSYSSFLYFKLTKQYLRQQYLLSQTNSLKGLNKRLSQRNKQLKVALDKIRQKIQFQNSQASIIHHQLTVKSNDVNSQYKKVSKSKVTKTDYFIYLKQMQRYCNQIIQIYGLYFQYSLLSIEYCRTKRSKSASKIYNFRPITEQAKKYQSGIFIKDMKNYWQLNKERIMMQKHQRQQQRRAQAERNQLVLKSLTQSLSLQPKKEKSSHVDVKEVMILNEQGLGLPQEAYEDNKQNYKVKQEYQIKQIVQSYNYNQIQEQQFISI